MRIITGTAKGKRLKSPKGLNTRPTADILKEVMFSAIQFDVENAVVLDLFAGSGQLGMEALSRGAKKAYFTDLSREAVAVIRENLRVVGFSDRAAVARLPAEAFLRTVKETFGIAFLDPPYEKDIIRKILSPLILKMSENGVIVCEHEKNLKLPEREGGFKIDRVYGHGFKSVTIYRPEFRRSPENENCHLSGEL
ncbi:MAG: 16S rRNA (guanine(966)-N(2))-methyltransferase RsmD [Oscillospiraceae bacterium]|jgi:16S rRNA (guanine(966)-N(2))-methyltransferase RsmD|nr:16S rRNA (guanine(966)-N(2))-methyltransferase RsmD [Oscillospiraceae bacterium]